MPPTYQAEVGTAPTRGAEAGRASLAESFGDVWPPQRVRADLVDQAVAALTEAVVFLRPGTARLAQPCLRGLLIDDPIDGGVALVHIEAVGAALKSSDSPAADGIAGPSSPCRCRPPRAPRFLDLLAPIVAELS